MKIKNTNTFAVELSKSAESSIYVASWNGRADLEFTDRDEHGTVHKIEVCMPLEVARNLIAELTKEITTYDVKQAEEAAEKAAEEAEKIAEEVGALDV